MLQIWVIFTVFVVGQAITPSPLTAENLKNLENIFRENLKNKNEFNALSILGLQLLGQKISNSGEICKILQDQIDSSSVIPYKLFTSSSAAQTLGSCSLKLNTHASQVLTKASTSDSVSDLFHAIKTQLNLGQKINDANVLKNLNGAIKKDDSISSLGLAFSLASSLNGATAIFDRIEDVVVQADEINSKLLQFEGGLSVSSTIITGAYALAKKIGKAPPISKPQAVKFANYFLTRRNVQNVEEAWYFLNAMNTLTSNDFHVPVAITLSSSPSVSEASPVVKVQVTNIMGGPLGPMNVQIDSAMRQSDGAVILSKQKIKESGTPTFYEIDLMASKPGRGFYELTVTATPSKASNKLAGNEAVILLVKVLGSVGIEAVEVGVADSDQSTAAKLTPVTYPQKLQKALLADHHHKLILKFGLKDKVSGEKLKVHQAFVKLSYKEDAEIIYVAEPDNAGNYKFDLDVSAKAKEFGSKSGTYTISLMIGDATLSNPINWNLADVAFEFPAIDGSQKTTISRKELHRAKPEIKHVFREPEKRPPAIVSSAFTLLCLSPFAIMLFIWMRLGVNASAFPYSLPSIGFHVGLGSIFGLYYFFWLQLNMFDTIKYLIMIGIVTFLCGNTMLVKIAQRRKSS